MVMLIYNNSLSIFPNFLNIFKPFFDIKLGIKKNYFFFSRSIYMDPTKSKSTSNPNFKKLFQYDENIVVTSKYLPLDNGKKQPQIKNVKITNDFKIADPTKEDPFFFS